MIPNRQHGMHRVSLPGMTNVSNLTWNIRVYRFSEQIITLGMALLGR